MHFAPVSPATLITPLNYVLRNYEGFRTVTSLIESGYKYTIESQHGISKKVAAVASGIILALGIALSAVPLTLHLTFRVIQSKDFEYASAVERTIAKMGAIAMLPGVAGAFVLFAMKALIEEITEVMKEHDHPAHEYEPYNPQQAPQHDLSRSETEDQRPRL